MGKLTLALAAGENPLAPAESEPWVTPDQLSNCSPDDDVDLDSVCAFATDILFIWSGRKYGVRTETVRPSAGSRSCGWQYFAPNWDWRVYYGEGQPSWVLLKPPVRNILGVHLDGNVLDPSEYRLFDNRKLVRAADAVTGTQLRWPINQRLELDDDQPGTSSVTYQWGQDVPRAALVAAQVFACELTKYLSDQPSMLPDRLGSLARQGVSQTVMDPMQFLDKGRSGLFVVDAWLSAVNPFGNRRRARIVSPETIALPRVNETVGSGGSSGYPTITIDPTQPSTTWEVNITSNGIPANLLGSTLSAQVFTNEGVLLGNLSIDTTYASSGTLNITMGQFLATQMTPEATWKLHETPLFNMTVIGGNLVLGG